MRAVLPFFLALLVLPSPSFAADPPGHHIEIHVEGLTVDEVQLAYHLGSQRYILDEHAKVQGSRIIFKGDKPLKPGVYLLVVPPTNDFFEFLVDVDQHFTLRTKKDDYIGNMSVSGSVNNDVFFADLKMIAASRIERQAVKDARDALDEGHKRRAALDADLRRIDDEVKAARRALVSQHGELLYAAMLRALDEPEVPEGTERERYKFFRAHFFDTVDFSDPRLLRTPIVENKVDQFLEKLTYQTPAHQIQATDEILALASANPEVYKTWAVHLLNRYAKSKTVCMDAAYVHVADRVYKAGLATWSDAETTKRIVDNADRMRPTLCGAVVPDAPLTGQDGKTVSVQGIAADFTVLYVWKTDCGHCKTTGRALREQLLSFDGRSVALLTVETSLNEDWQLALNRVGLVTKNPMWVHAQVRGPEFHQAYDTRTVPQIFILDRDKRVVSKRINAEQVSQVLRFHLDKKD
ncbi:MAG: glutaredoxin [Kiritimatiellia bacterium]|jgi:glutaredoxin